MKECTIRGCRNLQTTCVECGRIVCTKCLPTSEWIKVSDKTPPNSRCVLIALYDDRPKVEMYFVHMAERMNEDWVCAESGVSLLGKARSVTHWMPLPDKPEK